VAGLEAAAAIATVASAIGIVEICRLALTRGRGATSQIWWLVLAITAAAVVGLVLQTLGRALSRDAAVLRCEDLRLGATQRLRRDANARTTHVAWKESGATLGRDIRLVGHVTGRSMPELTLSLLVFLFSISYLFWADWRMALVTLLPIALGFAVFGVITTLFMRAMKEEWMAMTAIVDSARPQVGLDARVNRRAAQARTAATVRAAAHRLSLVTDRFGESIGNLPRGMLGGRAIAEISFSPLTILTFVLAGGTLLVHAHWLGPVDVIPALIVGAGLSAPLLGISYLAEESLEAKSAMSRLATFLDGTATAVSGGSDSGDGLAFDLPDRGLLVVVESSPAGADRVIDWVTATTPAGRMAAVVPEPAVVVGPVGEFITADCADVDRLGDVARWAAQVAGIDEIIAAFPRGYDSVVGADVFLSYLQGQRLMLARAIAGSRDTVLLDTRAFADDADGPSPLRAVVQVLQEKSAVIVVTSSCPPEFTDGHLVLLDAGRVVESGTHDELIQAGGRYATAAGRTSSTLGGLS
jgi:ATP-binding cassette, subfamily B, bacterial IrtA/YbtP